MAEIWKDVIGYEGLYQVSSLGQIKSLSYSGGSKERILKQYTRPDGYLSVALTKDGKHMTKTVHRLVATAFLPNPNNLEMINHKDEVRSNNSVDNLEWCSRSYNQLYSLNIHAERKQLFADNFKNKSSFIKKGVPHKYNIRVVKKALSGEVITYYSNPSEAGKENNIPSGTILNTCKHNNLSTTTRKRTSKGFIWEFDGN